MSEGIDKTSRVVGPVGGVPLASEALAFERLSRFVENYDPRIARIPTQLNAEHVSRFLMEKARVGMPSAQIAKRWFDLAEFYTTRSCAKAWLETLDATGSPSDDPSFRSAVILAACVSVAGDEDECRRGWAQVVRLLDSAKTYPQFQALVPTFLAFAPRYDITLFVERATAFLQSLSSAEAQGSRRPVKSAEAAWAAGLELREMEDFVRCLLPRLCKGVEIRKEILAIADPVERLKRVVLIFSLQDNRYSEATRYWATHRLLVEARSSVLVQSAVIQSLRDAIGAAPGQASTLLNAIAYFGGALSTAETQRASAAIRGCVLALDGDV